MSHRDALASRRAEAILKERGIDTLPVDPFLIAEAEGIEVVPKPVASDGVSGMLIRSGDEFVIAYATHIKNEGFKRFAVSHELGHYFLAGHPEAVFSAEEVHRSHAGFVSDDRYEREADDFAAGLLMPRSLIAHELTCNVAGLESVQAISDSCGASLTASAIRLAHVTEEPIAVLVSKDARVLYCIMSEPIQNAPKIEWIRKGEPVPAGTVTSDLNANSNRVAACERLQGSSRLIEWFGAGPDVEVHEDAVGLGSYGKTLTVLSAQDWPDEDDEDEPEDEEPKFHRSRRR